MDLIWSTSREISIESSFMTWLDIVKAGGHFVEQCSSCSSSTKEQIPAAGLMLFYGLLPSPGFSWCFLASPPGSGHCACRHCDYRYGNVLLEELDYLCSLMELQVAPHAASSEEEQNPEGVRRDQQRAAVCGHHINNTSCLGLVLLLPPLNLLLLWFAPKQKLIHSHWFF